MLRLSLPEKPKRGRSGTPSVKGREFDTGPTIYSTPWVDSRLTSYDRYFVGFRDSGKASFDVIQPSAFSGAMK
jgi:hypothetical protein